MNIFDMDFMERQYGKEGAKSMVASLLRNLQEEVNNLQAAHQHQNWPVILVVTHRVNGSASYCGAEQLMDICTKLEVAIKTNHITEFERLYQNVLREIAIVEKVITNS